MTAANDDGTRAVDPEIFGLLRQHCLGQPARYPKGSVLYWQGDPVDHVFLLISGAVKISTISEDGQIHTYGIVGARRLLGANAYLLGSDHDMVAEAFEDCEVLVMPPAGFERALSEDARLSAVVMRELARGLHGLSEQMRDLSFLDVQQRLKRSLVRLAEEHGLATDRGIRINLALTHEEMGALVAANRSTITACLSELKQQGYLWTEGRRLVIIPPQQMEILDHLTEAVVDGDDDGALYWARRARSAQVEPLKALSALTRGMKQVDRSYSRSEIDLPDVVLAAYAMKNALPSIEA
ncbi:MAG: cyclic nucleotide-binding domain-containing protein, partial [Anaerolineae bacterium]